MEQNIIKPFVAPEEAACVFQILVPTLPTMQLTHEWRQFIRLYADSTSATKYFKLVCFFFHTSRTPCKHV